MVLILKCIYEDSSHIVRLHEIYIHSMLENFVEGYMNFLKLLFNEVFGYISELSANLTNMEKM